MSKKRAIFIVNYEVCNGLIGRLRGFKQAQIFAISLLLQFFFGDEPQGGGVDAVSQAGGRRPIGKEMPEMRIAMFASHLGAGHKKAAILFFLNIVRLKRPGEAGPAGAGSKLVLRAEKRLAGYDVHVDTFLFIVPVFISKGRLRAFFLGDFILQRC